LFNWRLDYCILKCSIFGEYYLSCLIGGILWVFSFLVNIYVIFNKSIFQFYLLVQKQQAIQNCESVIVLHISMQGQIQDFKLRGAHLKKIASCRGRREHFWGISCEKSRSYALANYFVITWKINILRHLYGEEILLLILESFETRINVHRQGRT
jgi:hypothetical protein